MFSQDDLRILNNCVDLAIAQKQRSDEDQAQVHLNFHNQIKLRLDSLELRLEKVEPEGTPDRD